MKSKWFWWGVIYARVFQHFLPWKDFYVSLFVPVTVLVILEVMEANN